MKKLPHRHIDHIEKLRTIVSYVPIVVKFSAQLYNLIKVRKERFS